MITNSIILTTIMGRNKIDLLRRCITGDDKQFASLCHCFRAICNYPFVTNRLVGVACQVISELIYSHPVTHLIFLV